MFTRCFISCFTLKVVLLPACVVPPVFLCHPVFSPPIGCQCFHFIPLPATWLLLRSWILVSPAASVLPGFQATSQHPLHTSCFSFDMLFLPHWCMFTDFTQWRIMKISGLHNAAHYTPSVRWCDLVLLVIMMPDFRNDKWVQTASVLISDIISEETSVGRVLSVRS